MTWTKALLYLLAGGWVIGIVLWPKSSNLTPVQENAPERGAGEGLYKASLTSANFGLLGVHFYESNANRKHWEIRSRFAELHRKENYAYLQQVDAEFFAQKTGNVVFTKSDYGRSQIDQNIIDLEGNVSIRSKRGYLFTMDKLNYNGTNHEFQTEEPVQMRGPIVKNPAMILRGNGLIGDIDREDFLVKRNVVAQKKLKSSEWLHIVSKSGEFFTDEQRAVFIGKAHSVMPKLTIESDIFEIATNKDQESLNARGNVVLKKGDRIGYADSAFLEVGGNQIVLEGRARIEAKDNNIEGRRIILYSDDDRVEVEQAAGRLDK